MGEGSCAGVCFKMKSRIRPPILRCFASFWKENPSTVTGGRRSALGPSPAIDSSKGDDLEGSQHGEIPIETTTSDDPRSYHINSDKIKRVLGFAPKHSVEIERGSAKKRAAQKS